MSLKSELNRLHRALDALPADKTAGKLVLPPKVWAAICGTVKPESLTPDELAAWAAFLERGKQMRCIEDELAELRRTTPNPTEDRL